VVGTYVTMDGAGSWRLVGAEEKDEGAEGRNHGLGATLLTRFGSFAGCLRVWRLAIGVV